MASKTAHGRTTRRCSASSTRCARGSSPRLASAAARSSARSCSSGRWTATVDGKPTPQALIDQGVVPFIKIDKGLEDEENGVQLMKPMPDLDGLLERAKSLGVFGTKERSVINPANAAGIAVLVAQQFEVAKQVLAHGMVPIIEPEVNIKSADRAQSDELLLDGDPGGAGRDSRRPARDAEAVDPGRPPGCSSRWSTIRRCFASSRSPAASRATKLAASWRRIRA